MTGIRHAPSIRSAVAAVVGALLALGFVHDAGGEVGPAFSVPTPLLEAALDCPDEFVNAGERDPVLLVHGLSTTAAEQWSWNYALALPERGYDVCLVTLPDRGFGDQQVSAEYVAHAVLAMQQRTGRHVDLVGHSLGGSMSRWAVRFWPGVRDAIDDFVALGAPHHGTGPFRGEADLPPDLPDEMPAVIWQFLPESQFVTTLDAGDQTPGEVDWTNLYSSDDQSVSPNELSMLDVGLGNPRVANILLQDVCPGREVSHCPSGRRTAWCSRWSSMRSTTTASPTPRASTSRRSAPGPNRSRTPSPSSASCCRRSSTTCVTARSDRTRTAAPTNRRWLPTSPATGR